MLERGALPSQEFWHGNALPFAMPFSKECSNLEVRWKPYRRRLARLPVHLKNLE
jgi:hypothetical protein